MELSTVVSIGLSILSICTACLILLLVFRQKLKRNSEEVGKIPLSRTIPFGVLILLSIILIGAAIGTKYKIAEGENINELVKGLFPIIRNSQQQLRGIETSLMSNENKLVDANEQYSELIENMTGYKKIKWHNRFGIKKIVQEAKKTTNSLIPWFNSLQYGACTSRILITTSSAMKPRIESFRDEVQDFFDSGVKMIYQNLTRTATKIDILTFDQRKVEFGQLKFDNELETRKNIVDSFELDMINVQAKRQKLVEQKMESLPDRQSISKATIILLCALLIILSIITIVLISRKPALFKKPTLIYIYGVVTILVGLIVIIISLDVIEKCYSNNDNFGLRNFVSLVPGNETVSICNTTFFGDLGNETLITYQDLVESFKFEEYRQKRLLAYVDETYSFHTPDDDYHRKFKDLRDDVERLQSLLPLNCFSENDQNKLAEYVGMLQNVLDENRRFEELMSGYNKFVANYTQVVSDAYNHYFSKALRDLEAEIYLIQQQIMAADFSCAPLLDKFVHIGQSICNQVNGPIDLFLIYLTIIVMMFVSFLVFNIVLYRHSNVLKQNEISDVKPSEVI